MVGSAVDRPVDRADTGQRRRSLQNRTTMHHEGFLTTAGRDARLLAVCKHGLKRLGAPARSAARPAPRHGKRGTMQFTNNITVSMQRTGD